MQELTLEQTRKIGERFFKMRDYTPVPFIILLLFIAKPSVFSATLGVFSILLGECIRIYSVSFIGTVSRTRNDHTGNNLITSGPFAIVRNPLYLGNFFITMGIACYSGQAWFFLLMLALFFLQYYFIISYEEGILERDYGSTYVDYKGSVPSFFPNKKLSLAHLELPKNLSMALKSEKRTLTAIILVLMLILFCS